MGLNGRGIVSIIQIVAYIPASLVALCLLYKHGLSRDLGWLFLTLFSITRIVGAVMLVISQEETNSSATIEIVALVLQSAGLSPLFLSTLGFLGLVSQRANLALNTKILSRLTHVVVSGALIFAIIGGIDSSPTATDDKRKKAGTYKKISALIFSAVYISLVAQHAYLWMNQRHILRHRRTLLKGISASLPFLFVRLCYSIGGGFSSITSKFSLISGSVGLYVVMSVIMEFIVVLIYCVVGMILPLGLDQDDLPASGKSYVLENGYPPLAQVPLNPYAPAHYPQR